MWRILKNGALGALNWRKQAPFGNYVLDFVSHSARLIVEADGGQHNGIDQRAHDEQRTAFLRAEGYTVLRYWNNDILANGDGVFRAILDAAMKTPANIRMKRWQTEHKSKFAAQVANLPLNGGGGEHMRAGGGEFTISGEDQNEAAPKSATQTWS